MKKVPFDIEYYKKHKPQLVTRDGRKAKLVGLDTGEAAYPLRGEINDFGIYSVYLTKNGFIWVDEQPYRSDFLMLIPTWRFWLMKCRVNLFSLLMLIPFLVLIYLTISLFNDPKYDQGSLIFGVIYGLVWLYMFTIIRYLWKGK